VVQGERQEGIVKIAAQALCFCILFVLLPASPFHEDSCRASVSTRAPFPGDAVPGEKKVEIIDYGIYSADVVREEGKDSPAGKTNYLSGIRLLRQTDRVPAVIGTRFGIRFLVRGVPATETVALRAVILYPGLRPPGSERPVYRTEDVIHVTAGETFFQGILLEFDWGLVPGKWTFQLFSGEKLMAEKAFEVYRPGKATESESPATKQRKEPRIEKY
jgi:hypothetical protein